MSYFSWVGELSIWGFYGKQTKYFITAYMDINQLSISLMPHEQVYILIRDGMDIC